MAGQRGSAEASVTRGAFAMGRGRSSNRCAPEAPPLLRVRSDIFNAVEVVGDREEEAPGFVDAGLPQIPALVVLLGVERWVLELRGQKPQLLLKSPPDMWRSILQGFDGAIR